MIRSPSWRLTEAKGNMSKFSPCLDFHQCDLPFLNKTGSLKMRFWFFFFWNCLALRILISFIWVKLVKWRSTNCNAAGTKSASLIVYCIYWCFSIRLVFHGAGGEHCLTHYLGWDLVTATAKAYDSHSLTNHYYLHHLLAELCYILHHIL